MYVYNYYAIVYIYMYLFVSGHVLMGSPQVISHFIEHCT